ncbi:hypothetical protein [Paenimyroides aestuarii]|uniref:Lipoprotein n=1 Tax=Paenimyroides aestuarii TaxID=2968490 RepID=A0ABY5NRJ4_9FLAO|nr:hypothetical protein [Paenimyroides aestuarii]UUV21190.1 hypothetical protein NPX36_12805 [Paenimyroides aestuarii]
MKKYNYMFFLAVLLSFFVFQACDFRAERESKLIKEGNLLVKKIEMFKKQNQRLPLSLEEIRVPEEDGFDVLYYYKRDSLHYTVSFPISSEEHKFYYSDTKQWEKGYREMK